MLLAQPIPCALALALANAGNTRAANTATMAITTSSSINVKPWRAAFRIFIGPRFWPNRGAHSSAVCASLSRAGLHQAPRFLPLLHPMEERVGRGGAFLLVSPLLGPLVCLFS